MLVPAMPASTTLTSADGTRLAAAYWAAPAGAPGVVIVHGLDSRKENHADFAAACRATGLAALAIDLRGHGASDGALDAGAVDDVVAAARALIRLGHPRVGIRGSSLGGMLALAAAPHADGVRCVVAICPARPDALAARLDRPWPLAIGLEDAVAADGIARGFWHATGDDRVPWPSTTVLAERAPFPRQVRIVLGGDHGSLQHDPAIQTETCAFLCRHLT